MTHLELLLIPSIAFACIAIVRLLASRSAINIQLNDALNRLHDAQKEARMKREQLDDLQERQTQDQEYICQLNAELAKIQATYQAHKTYWDQQQEQKHHFENIAQRVLQRQQEQLQTEQKEKIKSSLEPLQQTIEHFKQQLHQQQAQDTKDRHQILFELHHLKGMNQQLSQDALNLTQALKGQKKLQGNWGEMILERVLEQSGLRAGYEYQLQESYKDDSGRRFQPDVIIHLPQKKDIVIDAKMSLNAYEKYFNCEDCEDSEEKQQALNNHINSIKNHIKSLSKKNYHLLHGIQSLDYVLMFVPIEPAFTLAVEKCPEIIALAHDHQIILASPTNLMVSLKTIHHLWHIERQEQNAQQIAENAGKIYDKLVGYTEELHKLGRALETAQISYKNASKKLYSGRHNLIRQTEKMKEMGAKTQKTLAKQPYPYPEEL